MRNAAKHLLVNILELQANPLEMTIDEPPEVFGLEQEDERFEGRVTGRLSWRWIDSKAVATGRLKAEVVQSCVRCLEETSETIAVEPRLVFSNEPIEQTDEIEIGLDDEGVAHFEGDVIDPRDEIRSLLLLEMDDLPLCREDCRGLCPDCGANLNEETCDCRKTEEQATSSWKSQIHKLRDDM